MKREFHTLYDYETGGGWTVILAQSAKEIRDRYPELEVVQQPSWMSHEVMEDLRAKPVSIDDDDDPFLKVLRDSRSP